MPKIELLEVEMYLCDPFAGAYRPATLRYEVVGDGPVAVELLNTGHKLGQFESANAFLRTLGDAKIVSRRSFTDAPAC